MLNPTQPSVSSQIIFNSSGYRMRVWDWIHVTGFDLVDVVSDAVQMVVLLVLSRKDDRDEQESSYEVLHSVF